MNRTESSETRRTRPWVIVAVTAIVAAAVATPLTAYAVSASFTDVPPTNPFFDEIGWMTEVGIAEGYVDGTYRPTDPVTRQTMAAFMQRLYDLQEDGDFAQTNAEDVTTSGVYEDIDLNEVTVTVPEGTYATIAARFSASSRCSGGVGTCAVRLVVSQDGGPFTPMLPDGGLSATFDSGAGGDHSESHAIERIREAAPGTYVIKAQFAIQNGATGFGLGDMLLVADTDLYPSDFLPT